MQSSPALIKIDTEGVWSYCDEPILRLGLIRLFYTVLTKKDDGYYLVTPVETVPIIVEDAPFTVLRINVDEENNITLHLNDDTFLPLNRERSLRQNAANILYVNVLERDGHLFEARFTLSAYLEIAQYCYLVYPVNGAVETYCIDSFGSQIILSVPDA